MCFDPPGRRLQLGRTEDACQRPDEALYQNVTMAMSDLASADFQRIRNELTCSSAAITPRTRSSRHGRAAICTAIGNPADPFSVSNAVRSETSFPRAVA